MSDCAHKAYRVFAAVFPNLYAQKSLMNQKGPHVNILFLKNISF
ncbi:unnamed protein product [Fusarium graminearum]|uniref:Chromosome 3, complete genome n=1 Tax=Gibberella zeae (strain ATCC MYA-4620 / CBS 123657 / FGSC 9075 / NRRL 31084 / PH-1) TaxID=229533 RepID=A0A098E2Y3_GIBZE|nr:unnamed protein product [Fusarium graminearum]CZS84890.1 unnamed protein product [Fusarium graminearum]